MSMIISSMNEYWKLEHSLTDVIYVAMSFSYLCRKNMKGNKSIDERDTKNRIYNYTFDIMLDRFSSRYLK